MGFVYANMELINDDDIGLARRHIIGEEEIKSIQLNILVDTGAYHLCINETIQQQLDLSLVEKRKVQLANSSVEEYDVVGPIVLKFKNRQTVCNAMVLQGDSEPLLGAISIEDLDVILLPLRQEMIVNPEYPYYASMKLK